MNGDFEKTRDLIISWIEKRLEQRKLSSRLVRAGTNAELAKKIEIDVASIEPGMELVKKEIGKFATIDDLMNELSKMASMTQIYERCSKD